MQEYVETAKKTITNTTKKVVEKSMEIYEATKLSLKIASLKDDIEKKYIKMGDLMYKKYKGEEVGAEDVEVICGEVDGINAEIDKLSQLLAEVKKLSVCASCGAEISKTSSFCAKCGAKID